MAIAIPEARRLIRKFGGLKAHGRASWRVLLLALLCLAVFAPMGAAQQRPLALVGATLLTEPGVPTIAGGAVVLRGGRIHSLGPADKVALPPDAVTMALEGKFLTAGFWNAHVHIYRGFTPASQMGDDGLAAALAESFLRWGFTTVVDLGSWLRNTQQIRRRIEDGPVPGPRILTAGGGFVPLGGSPFYIKPDRLPELPDAARATARVERLIESGADLVKLFTGSWATPRQVVLMAPEAVRAATAAAHRRGILVFAHPSNSRGARVAVEGGVDVLAHTFPSELDGPWDRGLPAEMAARGVALVPTLALWRWELKRIGLAPEVVDRVEQVALAQLRAARVAGVDILFGTDVGYTTEWDTSRELALMAEAGLAGDALLETLTTAPARRFGLADRSGRLAVGYDADLVVLDRDPRVDPKAFAAIHLVIRRGDVVFSAPQGNSVPTKND